MSGFAGLDRGKGAVNSDVFRLQTILQIELTKKRKVVNCGSDATGLTHAETD